MTDTMTALPPVAKSFNTFCKKCDGDRYHTVLAHTTSTSAKMKCEVCGSTSTYKLPKAGAAAAKKRVLGGAAAKRKETAENNRKNAHNEEYHQLLEKASDDVSSYNMKMKFSANVKLQHPKFGLGFVKSVQADKIEVIFADEVRNLVHNRQ